MQLSPDGWKEFLRLARRHRVQGLAWSAAFGTPGIPDCVAEPLKAEAQAIARNGLRAAAECARLRSMFEQADLPLLFLKGLPVGKLAYGDPFLKASSDIDLLILPDDLAKSCELLVANGYAPVAPDDLAKVKAWHGRSKESHWRRGDGTLVELHTRLADHPKVLSALRADSLALLVEVVPGIRLPTFRLEQQLAYLAVHGASSAWFRLKWISDFAALVQTASEEQVAFAIAEADAHDIGRAFRSALILCRKLFGISVPAENRRGARLLAALAIRQIASRTEPTGRAFGTLGIHLSQAFMRPGLGFAVSDLRRQLDLALRPA